MNAKRHAPWHGYVLVEVIVSLMVFSIGMVSVMRTFSVAARARGVAQDYTVANFLCQKLMSESLATPELAEGTTTGNFGEDYFNQSWSRTVKIIKVSMVAVPKEEERSPKLRLSTGTRLHLSRSSRRTAETRAAQQEEKTEYLFREITVTVSWTRRGAQYSVTMETRVPIRDGAMSDART